MRRQYVSELKSGKFCIVAGWIEKIREQKTMIFLILRDKTGKVQISIEKEKQKEIAETIRGISRESVISCEGMVVSAPSVKLGMIEIIPQRIEIESVAEDIPIQDESSKELKMDFRWIELREDKQRIIFEIRTYAEYVMREYFIQKGFIEIHTPKISSQCSEGGAEVFKLDYYGEKAYLVQSPQFYKQMAIAAGFEKVFEVGTQYRAEKSYTARHAAESVALDFEVAHVKSHHDIIDIEEEFFIYLLKKIKEKYGEKIKELFGREVKLPETIIPRLKLSEVFEIFEKKYGIIVPEAEQLDLDPDQEKLICEYSAKYLGSECVFITDYPFESRAFYTKKIEGTYECMGFDLLYRGWEMNSGAVREHRYQQLKAQIEEKGMDSKQFKDYLKFFKYGCPSHGGIGFGIARFIAKLLDLPSIKESIFVFRGPSRIKP